MHFACPQCGRTLEYSGDAPAFCPYCGQRAGAVTTAAKSAAPPDPYATRTPSQLDPYSTTDVAAEALTDGGTPIPTRIGNYKLLRELGRGGMGAVYEALHESTGRHVALKLIAANYASSRTAMERFRLEGRLASRIAHPRCVFVQEVEEERGQPYIVMELMHGATLADELAKEGALPPEQAVARILDVIEGLEEAHQRGVIHRDVKPSNCFLQAPDQSGTSLDGRPRVKIGDFGLAKCLLDDAHLTQSGAFLGTPLFAAPEQIKNERIDVRTDVYAVAATLYCLLTGHAPFAGSSSSAILARIVSETPPPPVSPKYAIPPDLAKAVLRGLERSPENRWQNLDEFRHALQCFVPGHLSPSGLADRGRAFAIDCILFLPVWVLFNAVAGMFTEGSVPGELPQFIKDVAFHLLFGAYFFVTESLWRASLGKRTLRLRVRGRAASQAAEWPSVLLRSLLFTGIVFVLPNTIEFLTGSDRFWLISTAAGIAVVLAPMRRRNGFQGLHEWLSGTRVVQLPWPKSRRAYQVPTRRIEEGLTQPEGLPGRLGHYTIRGALRWTAEESMLLGEDPALGRQVWIWLRPLSGHQVPPVRREINRQTRTRWLGSGLHEGCQWDAFFAPPGGLLTELLETRGPFSWTEARPVLEQLAEELTLSEAEGVLPPLLSADQVWLQPTGSITLAGAPLLAPRTACTVHKDSVPAQRAQRFFADVTARMLEGRSSDQRAPQAPCHVPVPGHARVLVARLLGATQPPLTPAELKSHLDASRDRPSEVGRDLRGLHLWVLGACLSLGIVFMFLGSRLYEGVALWELRERISDGRLALELLADPEYRAWLRTVIPESLVRQVDDSSLETALQEQLRMDVADEQARDKTLNRIANVMLKLLRLPGPETLVLDPKRPTILRLKFATTPGERLLELKQTFLDAAEHADDVPDETPWQLNAALGVVLVWPVLWVLLAWLARGGLSYRMTGIEVVDTRGRPAARWRCALRAVIVWAPITGLLLLSTWAEDTWPDLSILYWSIWWLALGMLGAYIVLALRSPSRGWHDRLAGTCLVPR